MQGVNDAIRLSAPALCAVLALGGCATTDSGGDTQAPPYADLLSQPQRLRAVPGESGALGWQVPDAELRKYDKVLLERIQVRIADDARHKTIDPADLKSLVDDFRQSIVKALGAAYPVVAKPGSGVLRVRIAIYDLVPTQPLVSVGGPASGAGFDALVAAHSRAPAQVSRDIAGAIRSP
jgi:hypothetical protein